MLTPTGLWSKLHSLGRRSVIDALPVLERRAGEMLLSIASFRAGEGEGLLSVSRAVDEFCAHAKTVGETAVAVGSMLEGDLVLLRAAVQAIHSQIEATRQASAERGWDPSTLFVGVDVDGMSQAVLKQIRNGIGQTGVEHEAGSERSGI